jgi:hypothetical protein
MRDKLEGTRPADMPGVDLRKDGPHLQADTPHAPRRIHYVLGWIVAAIGVAVAVRNYMHHERAPVPVIGRETQKAAPTTGTPERTYLSSAMEPVVIAEFTPSDRSGDDVYAAKVRLIGKDGMQMRRGLPLSCADAPIQARLLRTIRVRSDTWRLRGGGEEKLLSEDDAEAALCGDFTGRDVARTRPE